MALLAVVPFCQKQEYNKYIIKKLIIKLFLLISGYYSAIQEKYDDKRVMGKTFDSLKTDYQENKMMEKKKL